MVNGQWLRWTLEYVYPVLTVSEFVLPFHNANNGIQMQINLNAAI